MEKSVNHYKNQPEACHARQAKRDLQFKSARVNVEKLRIDKIAGFEEDFEKSKDNFKRQENEVEKRWKLKDFIFYFTFSWRNLVLIRKNSS